MLEHSYSAHLQRLCKAAPERWPIEACTRQAWQWAWPAIVWSRSLGIPSGTPGGGNDNGLIPLLVLANHDSGSHTTGRWEHCRGEFVVRAGGAHAACRGSGDVSFTTTGAAPSCFSSTDS